MRTIDAKRTYDQTFHCEPYVRARRKQRRPTIGRYIPERPNVSNPPQPYDGAHWIPSCHFSTCGQRMIYQGHEDSGNGEKYQSTVAEKQLATSLS